MAGRLGMSGDGWRSLAEAEAFDATEGACYGEDVRGKGRRDAIRRPRPAWTRLHSSLGLS